MQIKDLRKLFLKEQIVYPSSSMAPSSGGIYMHSYLSIYEFAFLKERNRIDFKEGCLTVQRLKYSFVYSLWSWNRSY